MTDPQVLAASSALSSPKDSTTDAIGTHSRGLVQPRPASDGSSSNNGINGTSASGDAAVFRDSPVARVSSSGSNGKKQAAKVFKPLRTVTRRLAGRFLKTDYGSTAHSLVENAERSRSSRGPSVRRTRVTRNAKGKALASRKNLDAGKEHLLPHRADSLEEEEEIVSSDASEGLFIGNRHSESFPSHHPISSQDTVLWFELMLRQLALLLIVYQIGARFPLYTANSAKVLEYVSVAWLTCLVIIFVSWVQTVTPPEASELSEPRLSEGSPKLQQCASHLTEESQPLLLGEVEEGLEGEAVGLEATSGYNTADKEGSEPPFSQPGPVSPDAVSAPARTVVHPALTHYYIIDTQKNERIFPNDMQAMGRLDTEYFLGNMMILIRTPDADDPSATSGKPENWTTSAYLRGKQRRFEFQFQVQLKKIPTGRVYFATELQEPVKMGMIQRAFVSAAMAFVKTTNKSFHYSITGSSPSSDGKYEKPHMSFPVEEGMNRVVATPKGQLPPQLGTVIEEDDVSVARRKKGARMDWKLDEIYTFALWSQYVDFLEWRVLNLPGIRPFNLTSVIGTEAIRLVLYEIPDKADKHYRKDMQTIITIEMSNAERSGMGPAARKWTKTKTTNQNLVDTEPEQVPGTSENVDTGDHLASRDSFGGEVDGDVDLPSGVLIDEADEEAVAELGGGIYVRSGDQISLRESNVDSSLSENRSSCFVTAGGGFAVLQEQSSETIVIEKVTKNRRSAGSQLIHSGDVVRFKLEAKGKKNNEIEFKYLSVHRGWWLKWVSTPPSKNGHFTLLTHETEYSVNGEEQVRSAETQSSYLTLGGSFWLQHKRWSKFMVGVSAESSATYGGRMLGLYSRKDSVGGPSEDPYLSDEGEVQELDQLVCNYEKGKSNWMRPLQLRAYESYSCTVPTGTVTVKTESDDQSVEELADNEKVDLVFSSDDFQMDAPAWLEIMNRRERIRQLTYAVRVLPAEETLSDAGTSDDEFQTEDVGPPPVLGAFIRLRTGAELAQIMRVGLNWRHSQSITRRKTIPQSSSMLSVSPSPGTPNSPKRKSASIPLSPDSIEETSMPYQFEEEDSEYEWDGDAETTDDVEMLNVAYEGEDTTDRRPRKGRKLIGKIAKSVKRHSTTTGKSVVRRSLKVGKGTVSAGKAIIAPSVKVGKGTVSAGKAIIAPIRHKNPPEREPKAKVPGDRKMRKRRERDLHAAISRSMRRIEKVESKLTAVESPTFVAGELCAPEQSCRTVSKMLSMMSNLPRTSQFSDSFSELLATQVVEATEQDGWFLQGGALQLGVVPQEDKGKGQLVAEGVVARCLWESHWREEWYGMYESCVQFYAPLSKVPCLELSFQDIQSIRRLGSGARSPLPGFPMLVIETAWLCHYAVFSDETALDNFSAKARLLLENYSPTDGLDPNLDDNVLSKARFWQGFQSSVESSLSFGKGKWAEIFVGKQAKRRTILNGRRMKFDLDAMDISTNEFVQGLLSASLSFSLDSLTEDPGALIRFLDATSYLRTLTLQDLNLKSASTFCVFANLYHCLLQHTLLLSVNGPLKRSSYEHIMRTSCYEIGGDVFSLAEIQSCIIRGQLSRPVVPKAPYVETSKQSRSYRYYALGYTTPRVNFVLNSGHAFSPKEVPILDPETLESQLNTVTAEFIRRNIRVDSSKKTIVLPKVCDVYRNDFGTDFNGMNHAALIYCMSYLDESMVKTIRSFVRDEPIIKYQFAIDQYHSVLEAKDAYPVYNQDDQGETETRSDLKT